MAKNNYTVSVTWSIANCELIHYTFPSRGPETDLLYDNSSKRSFDISAKNSKDLLRALKKHIQDFGLEFRRVHCVNHIKEKKVLYGWRVNFVYTNSDSHNPAFLLGGSIDGPLLYDILDGPLLYDIFCQLKCIPSRPTFSSREGIDLYFR